MQSQMESSAENSGTWILCGGFEGVEHEAEGGGVQFNGEVADLEATYLVGKIKAKAHPFVEYFKFLKQFEDKIQLQNIQFRHRHRHISR